VADSEQPVLIDPFHGMDRSEANYHRAMHYLAGALWFVGAADEALQALNKLVTDAIARPEVELRAGQHVRRLSESGTHR
jgi:hypothetical protein